MRPPELPPVTPSHLTFIARAGEVLASSLDYEHTLQQVARLALPVVGDMCIVDVVEDGRLRRVATAHLEARKNSLLERLREAYPPAEGSPQPAARVLRSGQLELLEDVTPETVAAHTLDPVHAQLILDLGLRSHLAVPLIARGLLIGVASFGITESARRYGADDVAMAQDLARLAALAIDNARLYAQAQRELAERRAAEEQTRLSEERLRGVLEQSPLSTQILAPDGMTLRVNRAWEALWGVTLDQVAEYNILNDPQLDAAGITPLLRRAFAGEAVHLPAIRYDPNASIPDRSRHLDPVRWVRAFAYPVRAADGEVREVVLIHEDVTEEEQRQQRLRASETRLRLALAAGRMNAWDWNLATDVVECSENARAFWGIEVGRSADFLAVIHPDDLASVDAAAREAIAAADDYGSEYRLRTDEGVRWVQSRGRVERAPDGRAARIFGVTVDITDLKQAEANTRLLADAGGTLGASLDYHATLQNLAHLVVPRFADWYAVDLMVDEGTLERVSVHHPDAARVAMANELFLRFPPRRTDPAGAWRVIESGEAEWATDISDDLLRQGAYNDEHYNLLKSLHLRSYIAVPLIARGGPIGVLTFVHAESGRRYKASDVELAMDLGRRAAAAVDNAQLYEQLRIEDRRKDEFLATLAHELRNPLAPIRTGLALLGSATSPESAERTRQVMERQLAHMVRLIDDLLDLSRITRGKIQIDRERIDLASVIDNAIEANRSVIDAAGLTLVTTGPGQPVLIDADRTRLVQAIGNLLSNAAKFTPRGGRVEVELIDEGDHATVRVTDSGIGIPPQMLAHIFDMFVQVGDGLTRTHSGLGIGLTLVRRLVDLHGGHIWAESLGEGHGSRFVLRLPKAVGEGAAEADVVAPPALEITRAHRVLVVDDNVDAAEMLAALLAFDGHDVRTAPSGPAALDVVRDFTPEIAFLDIGLPGMNGYELAQRLRARPELAGLMLVAVTGWGQDEDRRQSRNAGIDHHLTKPVDPHVVRALVRHRGQAS